jgi:hypothetical protein
MKRYLILTFIVFSLISVGMVSASDDGVNEFCAIDVTPTDDAKAFAQKMSTLGWTNRGVGHSLYDADAGVIWDIDSTTAGPDDNGIKAVIHEDLEDNQADFLYVGAHGSYSTGELFYEEPPLTVIASPDTFKVWDEDLEWAVFAACSVLNVNFDNGWPSGPGVEWAKALRGKNNPAHGLFGYHGSSPGVGTDKVIAEDFVDKLNNGKTFIVAWKSQAGRLTNWAVIMNVKNEADTLTSATIDSTVGRLYYYSSMKPNGAPITVANTSDSTGKLEDLFSEKGEDIYLKGTLLPPDKEIYVYIIKYKLLKDGEAIQPSDIVNFKKLTVDSSTNVHEKIWTTSSDDSGLYGMVVDVDANGRYNEGIDILHQFKIGPPCKVKIDNLHFSIPNGQTQTHHIKVKNNWVPEDKLPIILRTIITNPGGWVVNDGVSGKQIDIPTRSRIPGIYHHCKKQWSIERS